MNSSVKKLHVALILVAFLAFPLAQATTGSSVDSTVPEEALAFLEEVVQLDVSKYNVTLVSNSFDYTGPPQEPAFIVQENLKYTLEFEDSKVDAIFAFKNGTFAWCGIYVIEGSPLYSKHQPDNDLDRAKGVLERCHNYIEVPGFHVMRDLLGAVDKLENTVKTLGNMKLEITQDSVSTRFLWSHMYSGIDTKALSISFFLNGNLRGIMNYLCLTTVGDAEVNVSEEEAINIAMEYAKGFSWKAGVDPDNMVEVKDFKILESPVKAELSMQPREALTLYPYWYVELYLDKVYPGGVSSIHVGLWADTGKVNYCQEMSYGGGLPPDDTETDTTTPPPDMTIIAAVAATTIVIAIAAVLVYFAKVKKS